MLNQIRIFLILFTLLAATILSACQMVIPDTTNLEKDRLEANKEVVRRFYDELWNEGNMAVADEIIHPDFIDEFSGQNGIEALKGTVMLFRTAFPDMKITYEIIAAEGDIVVAEITNTQGTYQGGLPPFFGIPDSAIGNEVVLHGIDFARIEDGKMTQGWGLHDDLGWLQQLDLELAPTEE